MKISHRGVALATAGAIGLAPLLGVVGASAASPKQHLELDNHWSRLILEDTQAPAGVGKYIGVSTDLTGKRTAGLAAAESAAGSKYFDLPRVDTSGQSISDLETGECLAAGASFAGGIGYDECNLIDPKFVWNVSSDRAVESESGTHLGFDDETGRVSASNDDRYRLVGSATGQQPTSLVVDAPVVDHAAKSAIITGSAQSSAWDDVEIHHGDSWVSTQADGTFVLLVTGLEAGVNDIVISQKVDGKNVDQQTVRVTIGDDEGEGEWSDLEVTSHKNPGTYTPSRTNTFEGTATPGAEVKFFPFGLGQPASAVTTKADDTTGQWKLERVLGPTTTYNTAFSQSLGDKTENVTGFVLAPEAEAGAGDLEVTSHHNPGTYTPGRTNTFEGTATPGATVKFFPFGTANPGSAVTTSADENTGAWKIQRVLGPSSTYNAAFTQTVGAQTNTISGFVLTPATDTGAGDLTVTSHTNPGTYQPNKVNEFEGMATPGSTVKFFPFGTATPGSAVTTTADPTTGAWKLTRVLGPSSTYNAAFTQTVGAQTNTISGFVLTPAN